MSVDDLLLELKNNQIELWLDAKLLRFRAPEGQLDQRLLAQLRRHKSAIIERLGETRCTSDADQRVEPMSVGQEALCFLHSLAPLSSAYNVASAAQINSPVDVDAMRTSLEQLVHRHELLRTTCELRNGQPSCVVHPQVTADFQQIDLPNATASQAEEAIRAEYQRPFNLATGPLFRSRLFTMRPQQHVLLFTLHHIVFDFWSLWLIHDELRQLYQQHSTGETALLPTATSSYFEFVRNQRSMLVGNQGEVLWDYWRDQLAGDLSPLELPSDFKRPEQLSYQGATHHFTVPKSLSLQIRQLAASRGATPFVLLLSLFKVWLHQVCDRQDLIVGTTTAGRSSEFIKVVGYFVNTLAIRTQIKHTADGDSMSFADFVAHVKGQTLDAIAHQDYPFPTLIDRLNPPRNRGQQPICNVMFGLQKPQQFNEVQRLLQGGEETLDWGGLEIQAYELDQQEGQFDLTLELFDTGESFLASLKYNVDLFAPQTINRFANQYLNLATQAVADPDRATQDFDVVDTEERERLLALANGGRLADPNNLLVHAAFEQSVRKSPDSVAIVSGAKSLSYGQLNRQANQLARVLQLHGVQQGTFVACDLQRGLDVPLSLLAIFKAGGVYVPVDTANPSERIAKITDQFGEETVWLTSHHPNRFHESISNQDLPGRSTKSKTIKLDDARTAMLHMDDSNLDIPLRADAAAYAIFTSGSTGQPKGVVVSHQAISRHLVSISQVFRLIPQDRVLQFSNLAFDPSLEQMLAPWSVGATVVLTEDQLMTPDQFWQFVDQQTLSVVNLPPAYFRECSQDRDHTGEIGNSLRLLIIGGDEFPVDALDAWRDSGVQVLNAYGPTEAVITATTFDMSTDWGSIGRIAIGRPKPGMRAYVLDARGRLAPLGTPGELYLAGKMLASFYLGDDELSNQRFVLDPWGRNPEDRMYRTGDRVRWNHEGNLEFLGRQDHQIKVNGFRIETGEIENTLGRCPLIRQCHVEMRCSPNGERRLVAWVVANQGSKPTSQQLREFCSSQLPSYMVPRHFMVLDEMPLRVSGKINSDNLPAPSEQRCESQPLVPPRSEIERLLAGIWLETLEVPEVGIHDSFFDLGGGSLTSLRIAARANDAGLLVDTKPIEPELLFRSPTIAEMAAQLDPIRNSTHALSETS